MALPDYSVPKLDGTPPTYSTPAASESVRVGATLIVRNNSTAAINVTMVTPGTVATGDQYPDKVYSVAAAGEVWIPILSDYLDPATRKAVVNFSATASVLAAVVNI